MPAILQFNNTQLSKERLLPASKSISNRVLVIRKLANKDFKILNISNADDTVLMSKLLEKIANNKTKQTIVLNTENAGTVLRFLVSVCAFYEGEWMLTGNERMKQRPIADLIGALIKIGADIKYTENYGFPPIHIKNKVFYSNETFVDTSISSQYVSSLMLIAPYINGGLTINLKGNSVSLPYIKMTATLMKYFGADVSFSNQKIIIPQSQYVPKDFYVENDWSSASYSFLEVAVTGNDVLLNKLYANSLQGDVIVREIFSKLGIKSFFESGNLKIIKTTSQPEYFEYDFTQCPDLFLTVAIACAALNIKAKFSGLQNQAYKECDRLSIFIDNITKLGYNVNKINNAEIILNNNAKIISQIPLINSASDHRIAMSFAYLTPLIGKIIIDKPNVTSKSFPYFWRNFINAGFNVEEC